MEFEQFPKSNSFVICKMNFKSEVCSSSSFPTDATGCAASTGLVACWAHFFHVFWASEVSFSKEIVVWRREGPKPTWFIRMLHRHTSVTLTPLHACTSASFVYKHKCLQPVCVRESSAPQRSFSPSRGLAAQGMSTKKITEAASQSSTEMADRFVPLRKHVFNTHLTLHNALH